MSSFFHLVISSCNYTQSIPFSIKLPAESEWDRFDLCLKISEGLQDIEKGRVIPGEQVMERLKQKLDDALLKNHPSETKE